MLSEETLGIKTIPQMIDFIETYYHKELKQLMAELLELAQKLQRVHGNHPNWQVSTFDSLNKVWHDIKFHMDTEEGMLFPLLKSDSVNSLPHPEMMKTIQHSEHQAVLATIHKMNEVQVLPADACRTWKKFRAGMLGLEQNLIDHFEFEEKVLIPAVIAARGL